MVCAQTSLTAFLNRFSISFPHCRAIKEVWVASATEGRWQLTKKRLQDMIRNGINAWPAIMYETFGSEGIGKINQKLKEYEIRPKELEIEYLEPYPFVLENLKKHSISLHT